MSDKADQAILGTGERRCAKAKAAAMAKKSRTTEAVAFGKRLRTSRRIKFRFAKGLAFALGVEEETYNTWERGEHEPPFVHLIRISMILTVTLDYLIAGRTSPTEPVRLHDIGDAELSRRQAQ